MGATFLLGKYLQEISVNLLLIKILLVYLHHNYPPWLGNTKARPQFEGLFFYLILNSYGRK